MLIANQIKFPSCYGKDRAYLHSSGLSKLKTCWVWLNIAGNMKSSFFEGNGCDGNLIIDANQMNKLTIYLKFGGTCWVNRLKEGLDIP